MEGGNHGGLLAAVLAFTMWGLLPLFWIRVGFLDPVSIVAQRSLWSLLILTVLVSARREWGTLFNAIRPPGKVAWFALSSILLSCNWVLYIWATLSGRVVEGSLGYYLNPFFNMLFGLLWFGEKFIRLQKIAIAVAFAGVAIQIPAAGGVPWLALALACSFSLYAVVKKQTQVQAHIGLIVETMMLAPLSISWLLIHQPSISAAFGNNVSNAALVVASGLVTTLPLLCFGHAAKHIRLSTLGMMQFIGPTFQFLIGWLAFGEAFGFDRMVSFSMIWIAVWLYVLASRTKQRRNTA